MKLVNSRVRSWQIVLAALLGFLGAGLADSGNSGMSPRAVAQEAKAPAKGEAAKAEPAKGEKGKEKAKAKGRLPTFFKDVVNDGQRDKIYAIQAKYDQQTDELAAQIKALQKKELDEIEALLSTEQKEKLARVRGEAESKKKQKAEEMAKKPAESEKAAAK